MIHRLFPTAGDVVAAVGWAALFATWATAVVVERRRARRVEQARHPVADRYAPHRPRQP